MIYHNKLGTQGLRMHYVRAIANLIGKQLNGDTLGAQAHDAATLAKADLLTGMVGEFPELQVLWDAIMRNMKGWVTISRLP